MKVMELVIGYVKYYLSDKIMKKGGNNETYTKMKRKNNNKIIYDFYTVKAILKRRLWVVLLQGVVMLAMVAESTPYISYVNWAFVKTIIKTNKNKEQ
jgi:hypothetical protein